MGSDADSPGEPSATDDGLGPRGVVLVGALLFALIVVPALIYWRPPALPFLVAFLVLPLAPAIVLGLVAVWSLTESDPRRFEE